MTVAEMVEHFKTLPQDCKVLAWDVIANEYIEIELDDLTVYLGPSGTLNHIVYFF